MSKSIVKLATCTLNQFAMDFEGNKGRIIESIEKAKEEGAKFRLGPELEIPGYSCEDHFLEPDTFNHSAEILSEIIASGCTNGILCDIGLPFYHNSVPYNCRVIVLDGKIRMIRPKMYLAGDGNYREMRWFSRWTKKGVVEKHKLAECLQKVTKQTFVPFGHCYVETRETKISSEICEELWTPNSPNIELSLCGVEIFTNPSGSHHQLRKLTSRVELIKSATRKNGGVYMYSNMRGCDGTRMNFDGGSLVSVNGEIVEQGKQFSLREVEVTTAVVDLEQVRMHRMKCNSRNVQSSEDVGALEYVQDPAERRKSFPDQLFSAKGGPPKAVFVDFSVACEDQWEPLSAEKEAVYLSFEEEIARGPAQWMWDYLRRTGASGFFLPLSGGADSSSTATIVRSMCEMVCEEMSEEKDGKVRKEVSRILCLDDVRKVPSEPAALCESLFHTCYMGTENSSEETKALAKDLAAEIGSSHHSIVIDAVVTALLGVFSTVAKGYRSFHGHKVPEPRYESQGGGWAEDKALQNIQARLRMVIAYMLAQLLRWLEGKPGWLLVLGSANVDEGLRGYLTKYDCSSADLNPIGGISKNDLRRFLVWASENMGLSSLKRVVDAPPSAELKPQVEGEIQKDEDEMGMTYAELTRFGILRKINRCGPVSMFKALYHEWTWLKPAEVAAKVKRFFKFYSINRHKMTTLTPSVHMENYSPEDNRHDLRQIFYNTQWPFQFRAMDELAANAPGVNVTKAKSRFRKSGKL